MAFAYFILGQYDKGREFAEKSVELAADVHSLFAGFDRQRGTKRPPGLRMLASELYSS